MDEGKKNLEDLAELDKKLDVELEKHKAELEAVKREQAEIAKASQEVTRKQQKLRELLAEKQRVAVDNYHSREQAERQREEVAAMERKLLEPTEKLVPQLEEKRSTIAGAEKLEPETVKVLQRIFNTGRGWDAPGKAQMFVDGLISLAPEARAAVVSNLHNRILTDDLDADDLSLEGLLRASGAVNPKQLTQQVDKLVKQIALLPSNERQKVKKAFKKKIKGVSDDEDEDEPRQISSDKPRPVEADEDDEDSGDEPPPSSGGSRSPWSEFD